MKKNLFLLLLLVSIVFPMSTIKANAAVEDIVKQTTGVVLGVGAGPVVGGLRGFLKGLLWGKDATAEALGDKDGVAQQAVGYATGGVVGAAAGGVSGVLMGAYDGIKYGWDKPWSHENFSCGGKGLTDYDPFKWE
ncbi:MAG: hypothetical protein HYY52_04245 [Candidatus Melainabacteria bacterium]|nr:hypothetical protein [Candidatus Melainabacteria bacterium]